MGRVLGLDVGTKTIGVAMSDETRLIASPVRTVARRSVARDVDDLATDIEEGAIEAVVVGLPYELDGTEARSARLARQIGEAVRERFELPVHYVDERFTSVDAERQLIQARVSRQRRKEIIDQQAACIILQSFLDHPELDDA
ncbi:MAG: Holliday junction resolvase RuvX [Myxococcota bacterium]